MSTFPAIPDPWYSKLRLKVFPAKRAADTLQFKRENRGVGPYRWLLFPALDAALILLAIQSLGPLDPESGHRPMDPLVLIMVFAGILVVRIAFLIIDLRLWFDVKFRNQTPHKRLRRRIAFPLDPQRGDRIDTGRPLLIDGASHPAGAVRGIEITGIAFVAPSRDLELVPGVSFASSGPPMVGDRTRVSLDDPGQPLPPPWTTDEADLAPVYSPTLVFRETAFQLFDTRDLGEAIDFTRRLRHAFSLKGPLRLLGLHPFLVKQNRSPQATVYPLLGALLCIGSLILGMLPIRGPSPFQALLSVPAYYLAQEGLMFLCQRSIRPFAAKKGEDNVAWLNSNIADPT